jgi:hypothetical protein
MSLSAHPEFASALQAELPDAHAFLASLEGQSPQAVADALNANRPFVDAILAWIKAHPGQIMAWMTFILSMFGVVIPPLPIPVPTPSPVA